MNPKIIALNNPIDHAKILDEASDPLVVLNSDYQFTYANKAFAQALGKPLETIIGNDLWGIYQKDGADMRRDAIKEVVETGQTKVIETIVPKPSGNLYFITTFKPIFDEQNVVISVVATAKDITDRKQAEEELLLLTAMIEQSSEGIIRTDTEFRINYINDATRALYGWSLDELRGKTPDLFNVDQHADEIQNNIYTMVSSGKPYLGEALNVRKDGSTFYCQFKVSPLKNEKGEIYGYMSSVRDITERKQAEEELLNSEEEKSAILNTMSELVVYQDINHNIIWSNKAAAQSVNQNVEDLKGRKCYEIWAGRKEECEVCPVALAIEAEKMHQEENTTPDGKTWLISGYPIKNEIGENIGAIEVTSDITERKKSEQQVKKRIKELETLYSLGEIAGKEGLTLDKLYQELTDILPQGCQYPEIACTRIVIGDSEFHTKNFAESAWMQSAPVKVSGTVVGKIEVGYLEEMPKEGEGSFLKEEKQLIDSIAERLGQITQRRQAEDALQQTLKSLRKAVSATIQVIISTLEAKDPYTAGHQVRVADLTRAIATEMKFSKDRIEGVFMAASIHDIGKLSVPAEILSKPGKLTETEFSLIKEHSKKGYEILKNVESSWPLAEIVYQHHERMDGSGYPRNLKGDEILMEARIMAVADVVEAMASHRPYRPTLGIDAALKEIEDNKGTLYDAHVVDVCLRLFREKGFQLKDD